MKVEIILKTFLYYLIIWITTFLALGTMMWLSFLFALGLVSIADILSGFFPALEAILKSDETFIWYFVLGCLFSSILVIWDFKHKMFIKRYIWKPASYFAPHKQ